MTVEKKQAIKNYLANIVSTFTGVLPISLCAAVFMGFNYLYGMKLALVAAVLCPNETHKKMMAAYSVFLVLMYASLSFGTITLSLACFIGGALSAVYFFIPKQFSIRDNPVTSGLMLSTALSVTVMLTTHYFGIGATGDTVKEMIASYLSLGFHPNWRGVLYGTIVMVIMITFPRKFKKLCSYIKAPFIAIIVTLILNLFLNPSDFRTAINEIGNNFIYDKDIKLLFLTSNYTLNIPAAVACGIAVFFICIYSLKNNNTDKTSCIVSTAINTVSGTLLGLLLPYGVKTDNRIRFVFKTVIMVCLIIIFFSAPVERIPLHSLAVVMIVGAWESVEWRKIKDAFSSVSSVIFFVLSFAATLYFGYVYGILISTVLYTIYLFAFQKSKADEAITD